MLKTASPEQLIEAVQVLARGEALLAPDVTRRVIAQFAVNVPRGAVPYTPAGLTPREQEVLALVARGRTNAEIAVDLVIGEATVKTHVSNLLLKLEVRDRTQLVVWAYEHGVATPGTSPPF